MRLPLQGIVTPLVTPLDHSGSSLDARGLERLIEYVIAGGVSGVFVLGTTGEFPSLGLEIKQEIIRHACTLVNRRVPVLAGISSTAITETLHLADAAVEAGADALVLAAPYYFQHSQSDLLRYLERVTEKHVLPLFLYNIPPHLTRTSFDPETVRRAADLPGVIGLKDSSGDLKYLEKTVELMRDRPGFSMLAGSEDMLLKSINRGAHGGVCGGSNLNPRLFVDLYDSISKGATEAAVRLQEQVDHMGRALYRTGHPGGSYLRGIKAALALAGICNPEPALPFGPFSEAEYALIKRGFETINF